MLLKLYGRDNRKVWKKIKYKYWTLFLDNNLRLYKESFATIERLTSKNLDYRNEICKINAILEKKSALKRIKHFMDY
jgi:hypothetical protein